MSESAREILREVLSEQIESETEGTPTTEEIRMRHTFSEPFLRKMNSLVKMQERGQINEVVEREGSARAQGKQRQEKQVKEEVNQKESLEREQEQEEVNQEESLKGEQEQEEQENRAEKKILKRFLTINADRATRSIAAACLACVILLSAGVLGYQGLFRAGRVGTGSSASYSTAATDGIGEAETAEEYDMGADAAEDEMVEESVSDADSENAGEDAENESNGEDTENKSNVEIAGNGADEKGTGNEADDEMSAGGENAGDGVSLKVTNVTEHSVTLEISNEAGEEVSYGEAYELECYDEETGIWTAVPPENEIMYGEIAYIVPDGENVTCAVDWSDVYGSLSAGTYRLVKEIWYCEEGISYALTVEFAVD
ncbi:MAG: hypothetical protein LIO96_00675 [Lachnospiraceae bacterium]|nr:hypothetical protein [Lachnospiraceae bacterium]